MRLLPHGPITRLSASEAVGSLAKGSAGLYSRSDWNAGRDLSAEERRSGMNLHLGQLVGHSATRPTAVAKCQPSDTHVNEIDVKNCGAFLENCPKGRWRKVSRQKTFLVENSTDSFSDPDKSMAPRVQSYGQYARRLGQVPEAMPALRFVVYREGIPLENVKNRLRYELGVEADAVLLDAPPIGHLSSISQFGSAIGVSKELLAHASRHYNLHPLIFDPRSYMTLEEMRDFQHSKKWYFYRVLLRCVDVENENQVSEMVNRLNSLGCINYFGIERFGIGGNPLFNFAMLREKGHTHRAVGSYLQLLAEANPFHYDFFLSFINADRSTAAGIAKMWSKACAEAHLPKATCRLIEKVVMYTQVNRGEGSDELLEDLWNTLPHHLFDDSGSECVWNHLATKRITEHGLTVVKGDLIRCTRDDSSAEELRVVRDDEEAQRYSVQEVVLPVPYRRSAFRQMLFPETSKISRKTFEEFASQKSLDNLFVENSQGLSVPCVYRPILQKPTQLQASIIRDPSSLAALKTDFFLKQERQSPESFNLSYQMRVREPCRFNVSQRFLTRIEPIRSQLPGEKSLVLSFILPESTSPFVLLREVLDLRYARFHDLFGL